MRRTYFGLKVYEDRLVRLEDIKKLPFYKFWEESSAGSSLLVNGTEAFVYLHDWENFAVLFIKTGKHRFSKREENDQG